MGRRGRTTVVPALVAALSGLLVAALPGSAAATRRADPTVTLQSACASTWRLRLTVGNPTGADVRVIALEADGADADEFRPVAAGAEVPAGGTLSGEATLAPGAVTVEVVLDVGGARTVTVRREAVCTAAGGGSTTAAVVAPTTVAGSVPATRPPATLPSLVTSAPPATATTPPAATTASPRPTAQTGGSRTTVAADGPGDGAGDGAGDGDGAPAEGEDPDDAGGTPDDAPVPVDFRFQPEGRMTVGVASRVSAQVTLRGITPDRALVTFDAAAPTTVLPAIVRCLVRGRLAYSAGDFTVVDDGPITVDMCDGRTTGEFTWTVVPRRAGPLPITVAFDYGPELGLNDRILATIRVDAGRAAGGGSNAPAVFALVALVTVAAAAAVFVVRRRRGPDRPRRRVVTPPPVVGHGRPVVFVSYSRRDRDAVGEIQAELESHGYDMWRDVDDIEAGEAWRQAIVEGLRRSVAVLFVVSPHSAGSMQVAREIALADEERKPIIPLVLPGEVELPGSLRYTLAGTQVVDLRVLSRAEAVARVSAALAAIVARSAAGAAGRAGTPEPDGADQQQPLA